MVSAAFFPTVAVLVVLTFIPEDVRFGIGPIPVFVGSRPFRGCWTVDMHELAAIYEQGYALVQSGDVVAAAVAADWFTDRGCPEIAALFRGGFDVYSFPRAEMMVLSGGQGRRPDWTTSGFGLVGPDLCWVYGPACGTGFLTEEVFAAHRRLAWPTVLGFMRFLAEAVGRRETPA
jgi:hypothetical protein